MNLRSLPILAAAGIAIALAACGSGGGGGNTPTVIPTPIPLPTRPTAGGDTFKFVGTLTRTDAFAYPSPTLPPNSANASVTQTIVVKSTSNPFGTGTVADFQGAETDAYKFQTLQSTSDLYFQATASLFSLLGFQTLDDIGDKTVVQYTAPQTIDQFPEVAGANWTNSPAATITQNFAGASTATRAVAADGSYADNQRLYAAPAPAPTDYPAVDANLTENPDLSGNYKITFHQNGRAGRPANLDIIDNYVFSAPTGGNITFSYQTYRTTAPGQPTPAPTPQKTIASWITPGAPLYSETNTNLGVTPIPAKCNVVPSVQGGMKLRQVVSSLDTVLGTTTTTTTDQYVVAGFGPVCVQLDSTIVAYYNYNLDFVTGSQQPNSVGVFSTPQQTTVISETLGQQTNGVPYTQTANRKTASGTAPISAFAIANARANVRRAIERERGQRVQSLVKKLLQLSATQGAR